VKACGAPTSRRRPYATGWCRGTRSRDRRQWIGAEEEKKGPRPAGAWLPGDRARVPSRAIGKGPLAANFVSGLHTVGRRELRHRPESTSRFEADGVPLAAARLSPPTSSSTASGFAAPRGWLAAAGWSCFRHSFLAVDERLKGDRPKGRCKHGYAAEWWSAGYGRRMNVQHWDDAYTPHRQLVADGIVNG